MAEGKNKELIPQAEVSVAVWTSDSADPAFRTARAGVRKPSNKRSVRPPACAAQPCNTVSCTRRCHLQDYGETSRVKTYEEPRMAYLFFEVHKASGLKARHGKPNGMCDPFCNITVGNQRARTHMVQARHAHASIARACTV